MRYTRSEIGGILSTRHGHSEDAAPSFFDFRLKITLEALEGIMRGYFVAENGTKSILSAVDVDDDGYVVPMMEIVV